jgi:hypothetical protein
VIVAPCSGLPAVPPLQTVCSALLMAPQLNASTVTVVGMKMAGTPPTRVPLGPVAVTLNVVEPVMVSEPLADPLTVQTWPTTVAQATPAWPELGGTFWLVGTMPLPPIGVPVGVAVVTVVATDVLVGVRVAVELGVIVGVLVSVGVTLGVAVAWLSILLNPK